MNDKLAYAMEGIDLREWLEQYTKTKNVGNGEFTVHCPVCFDHKSRLYINNIRKLWHCKHCNWGERINDVSVLMAQVSGRSLQSVRIEILQTVIPSVEGDQYNAALYERLTDFNAWNEEEQEALSGLLLPITLPGTVDRETALWGICERYAASRGIDTDLMETLGLRACMELRSKLGPFLTFPIIHGDTPVAWQGRRVNNNLPKYVSSESVAHWLWPATTAFQKMISKTKTLTLVEGTFDAVGCLLSGVDACASFGKHITVPQRAILKEWGVEKIYLGWDHDAIKDVLEAAKTLSWQFDVRVMCLDVDQEDGKVDMGDAIANPDLRPKIVEAFDNAIEVNSNEFYELALKSRFR